MQKKPWAACAPHRGPTSQPCIDCGISTARRVMNCQKQEKKRQNLKKDFATTSLKICLYIQTPRGLHIFLQGKRKRQVF